MMGLCIVKNKRLQRTFKIRLIAKRIMILFLVFLFELDIARYIEIAISMNNIVQTIGKTIFGGVIDGFIESYHKSIFVKREPINAVAMTASTERIRTFEFFISFVAPFFMKNKGK